MSIRSSVGICSPRYCSSFMIYFVTSRPASGICLMHELITTPYATGSTWVTPSPESITVPERSYIFSASRAPNNDITAYTPIYNPGTLKVSNMISAIYSRFSGVFMGGSVSTNGWFSGSTWRWEYIDLAHSFSISSQLVIYPSRIGLDKLYLAALRWASKPMW